MKDNLICPSFLFYFIIFGVLLISASPLFNSGDGSQLQYSDVVDLFQREQVASFVVDDKDNLILQPRAPVDDQSVVVPAQTWGQFREDLGSLIEDQYAAGTLTSYDFQPKYETPWILTVPPIFSLALPSSSSFFDDDEPGRRRGQYGSVRQGQRQTRFRGDQKSHLCRCGGRRGRKNRSYRNSSSSAHQKVYHPGRPDSKGCSSGGPSGKPARL